MTAADLLRAAELLPPGSSLTLPREALLEALSPAIQPANGNGSHQATSGDEVDEWLTAEEVAELLHVSARWCYDHGKEIGARRLSRRCIRFSSRAVNTYLARRTR